MTNNKVDVLVAQAYVREPMGGFGVAGDRHVGPSQDALWPSRGGQLPDVKHVRQVGRLYVLSDGMTRCADGHMASQLAVQTVGQQYYAKPSSHREGPSARLVRLQGGVWQAHLNLVAWNKQFFCGQKASHPDGKDVIYKQAQLVQGGKLQDGVAYCPLCNQEMVGTSKAALEQDGPADLAKLVREG